MCVWAAMTLGGCGEGQKVELDPKPVIQTVSVSPQTLTALKDTLNIVVRYTDGDGDLGDDRPNYYSVFVTDLRNGVVHRFRLQRLVPQGHGPLPITGQLRVMIGGIPVESRQEEKAVFELYIRDRTGQESNRIQTPELTIVP
jgi:hypothetical protein